MSAAGIIAFRRRLRAGDTVYGGWCSIPSRVSAELVGRSGVDWTGIDAQHALAGPEGVLEMLAGSWLAGSPALVRVSANDASVIGKSLDAGAIGVIVPMVNSGAQACAAVAACRFPPEGDRSYGAGRLGLVTPGFSPAVANELVSCFVMVETVEAVENIDEIVAVPGVDGVFVGPVDLAISAGMPATVDTTDPAFVGWLETVVAACERAGIVPGIFGGPAAVVRRFRDLGFRLIATAPDTALVQGGARALLAAVKAPGDSQ